jgi:hypothetical protein
MLKKTGSPPKVFNPSVEVKSDTSKLIKNYSLQGLSLTIKKGSTFETVWLNPKASIRLLESEITQQIKNLHRRRLIRIGN